MNEHFLQINMTALLAASKQKDMFQTGTSLSYKTNNVQEAHNTNAAFCFYGSMLHLSDDPVNPHQLGNVHEVHGPPSVRRNTAKSFPTLLCLNFAGAISQLDIVILSL